jgi:transcriptional regulator with XRE-family HTH domain
MDLAGRLKAARAALSLKQTEVAAQSGVSEGGYQKYEMGRSVPGGEAIAGFVRLGINANWLLTGEGPMLLDPDRELRRLVKAARGAVPLPQLAEQLEMPDARSASYHLHASEPAPDGGLSEINTALLDACLRACQVVHGEPFAAEPALQQLAYAADLYNLVVRMARQQRKSPEDTLRLEAAGLAELLRLFLKMGWARRYPLPPEIISF